MVVNLTTVTMKHCKFLHREKQSVDLKFILSLVLAFWQDVLSPELKCWSMVDYEAEVFEWGSL